MTHAELQFKLGPPSEFIITAENRSLVTEWAVAAGFPPAQVHAMSAPQLANLYHEHGDGDRVTEAQRAAATVMVAMMGLMQPHTLPAAPIDGPVHYRTAPVIRALGRGDAVMMVGPAGCGKTTIGEHAARALQLPFYITSVVNDPHELMGFVDGHGKYHETPFRTAFEHGGVWTADEIDAWDSSALLVANSALANGIATFPDMALPIRRHADFRMVATANTFGTGADRVYVGRTELDAASLDRFAVITVDYDLDLERMFAGGSDKWLNFVWDIRRKVQEKKIRHVVSSRAIRMGAAALRDGETWEDTAEIYLYKGMAKTDRSKIE